MDSTVKRMHYNIMSTLHSITPQISQLIFIFKNQKENTIQENDQEKHKKTQERPVEHAEHWKTHQQKEEREGERTTKKHSKTEKCGGKSPLTLDRIHRVVHTKEERERRT